LADNDREALIETFLSNAGWGDAKRSMLAGDASTRSYDRLSRGGESAVLMNAPPAEEEPACPPDASEAERRTLGYNALARLAGPDPRPFVAVAEFLTAKGLNAPAIFAADIKHGLILLEDLGDAIFNRIIAGDEDELPLYETAIDALAELHTNGAPTALPLSTGGNVPLLDYDHVALLEEVCLLTEWYVPACTGAPIVATVQAEFLSLWQEALSHITQATEVMILRDYHADNLIWLPDRKGVARAGIIDFQDALRGHRAYDLVSLLEDARRDVAPLLAEQMVDRYIDHALAEDKGFDIEAFRLAYALYGLQRNTKILGIFARLWKRDGKPQYPAYMPRVWAHVERNLTHPAAAPLKAWYNRHIPQKWRGDFLARKAATEGERA